MIISLHLMCLAMYTIKIEMVTMLCPYRYFPLKLAIHHFDCKMGPLYQWDCYFCALSCVTRVKLFLLFKLMHHK